MPVSEILTLAGFAAAILARLAWWRDRRRLRRADLNRFGFMPWTGLFFWMLLAAVILMALALRASSAG